MKDGHLQLMLRCLEALEQLGEGNPGGDGQPPVLSPDSRNGGGGGGAGGAGNPGSTSTPEPTRGVGGVGLELGITGISLKVMLVVVLLVECHQDLHTYLDLLSVVVVKDKHKRKLLPFPNKHLVQETLAAVVAVVILQPSSNNYAGGNGGSGVVVIKYQITANQTGTAKATGGVVSFNAGKTIHTFTNSGTFTIPAPAGTLSL